eukprot:scaffold320002_cov19-Tisochrysis_lutea.AAC.1
MAQKKSEGSGITIELRDSAKHKCLTDLKKVATDPEAMCGTGISIIERGVGVEQNCGNAQLFMGVGRPPGSTVIESPFKTPFPHITPSDQSLSQSNQMFLGKEKEKKNLACR